MCESEKNVRYRVLLWTKWYEHGVIKCAYRVKLLVHSTVLFNFFLEKKQTSMLDCRLYVASKSVIHNWNIGRISIYIQVRISSG